MERSTMLSMGKSTISTGPWLQVRKLLVYQRVMNTQQDVVEIGAPPQ